MTHIETTTKTADTTLTIVIDGADSYIEDADGGMWHPTDLGLSEIEKATDPVARAIELCQGASCYGDWKS